MKKNNDVITKENLIENFNQMLAFADRKRGYGVKNCLKYADTNLVPKENNM